MTSRELLAVAVVAAPALSAGLVAVAPRRLVSRVALTCAPAVAVVGLAIARSWRCATRRRSEHGVAIDAAGGLLVGVTARRRARERAGLAGVPRDDARLAGAPRAAARGPTSCCSTRFWAILLAIPLAGNLGVAWLLVEASTAPSALLVGFSGKARALEAGWKYLILTSLGLGVALLGIVILAAGRPRGRRRAHLARAPGLHGRSRRPALVAYLLLLAGLAAKIGWAPVHNWLPDAHSEAPAPVSALLSAALLPAVLLVAWRSEQALAPVVGAAHRPERPDRLRARLARRRGAVPLAVARLEAAARLLEPRAHGRDRARDRLRDTARARRRRDPRRRPRGREGARLLRGDPAARPRAAGCRARRHGDRPDPAAGSARRWASRSGRSPGCRPRRSSSARC